MLGFWKSPLYIMLLFLGPVFWMALWLIGTPLKFELSHSVWFYLSVIIVYPLVEEVFFRGGLQEYLEQNVSLKKQYFSISLANVLTSSVFCLMHLYSHNVTWSLLVFFPSMVFGWSKSRYTSILAPIAVHSFYNAGYYLLFA